MTNKPTHITTAYIHTCQRPNCGYRWHSYLERPKVCQRCKRYDWDQPPKESPHV